MWPSKEAVKQSKTLLIVVSFQGKEPNCIICVYSAPTIQWFEMRWSFCHGVQQADVGKADTQSGIDEERNGKRKWERRNHALLHVSTPIWGLEQLWGWRSELSLINYNHPLPTTILIVLRRNSSNQEILDTLLELRASCKPGPVHKGGSWSEWWKNSE